MNIMQNNVQIMFTVSWATYSIDILTVTHWSFMIIYVFVGWKHQRQFSIIRLF